LYHGNGWWHELLNLIKNTVWLWLRFVCVTTNTKTTKAVPFLKQILHFKFSTIICFETSVLTDKTVRIIYEEYTEKLVMQVLFNQLHSLPYKCTVFSNPVYGYFTIIPKQLIFSQYITVSIGNLVKCTVYPNHFYMCEFWKCNLVCDVDYL
jgi:hypothetical protein